MIDNIINLTATLFYIFSFVLYFYNFIKSKGEREAKITVLVGFVLSTILQLKKTIVLGHIPFSTNIESVHFFSWLLIFISIVISYIGKQGILIAFILPIVILLESTSYFIPHEIILHEEILKSIWFEIHVSTTLISYAGFSFAFISAVMYLFLFHEIKQKKIGFFFRRLPPLATMEELNTISIIIGFSLLTIGIVSGFIWKSRIVSVGISQDPKIILSFLIWILYFGSIHLRRSKGWKGIRIVYMSIIGFLLILLNFLLLKFFIPGSHSF